MDVVKLKLERKSQVISSFDFVFSPYLFLFSFNISPHRHSSPLLLSQKENALAKCEIGYDLQLQALFDR